MRRKLKCFYDEAKEKTYTTRELGLQVVEVDKIIGTLDKCGELDRRFKPRRRRDRAERFRRARLVEAYESLTSNPSLPPIELYRYRREYYVVDGHRRVAAALQAGREFLDAYVTDVIPLEDRKAQEGAVSRRKLELETGLKNVRLNYESGYQDLLQEIAGYAAQGDLKEKARIWYSKVFLPACREIERTDLKDLFSGLRDGDIFVMIVRFYRNFDSGFPRSSDFESVFSMFISDRKRLKVRLRRLPLIRTLVSVFKPIRKG